MNGGGLYYASQEVFQILGTKSGTTRTPVTLPASYNGTVTKTIATGGYSKLNLDINYTEGAAEGTNSIQVKIECSADGTNFYRIPNEAVSAGTSTLTAREFTFSGAGGGATATISIGLDIFYKWMKISAKETFVTNAGTVFMEATLSGK